MSRRDQFRQQFSSVYARQKAPKTGEKQAEKICGICKHYSESAFSGEGKGSCNTLKMGSDITASPPVFVLEGENGYMSLTLADATACKYYEKMEFIDHDGTECSDPQYRRTMRQLQDK
ncbi:MAG: hypothetical protein KKA60_04760 [Proteobacteria bacterium]|nr:hypothetical protein [Pseudomonadota bacterium]